MHDIIQLVKKEMPVVMVVTDMFINEALEVGKKFGIPDPPLVIVGHPFATLSSSELDNIVEKNFGVIVEILTGAP